MSTKRIAGAALSISIVGAGIYLASLGFLGFGPKSLIMHLGNSIQSDGSDGKADFSARFLDDRELVGNSHNVFVAKISKDIGTETVSRVTSHNYMADVVMNIKGNLKGSVVISRPYGYLSEGTTYVLATRYYKANNWYVVSIPPQITVLSHDSALNEGELRSLASKNAKVQLFQGAYPEEKLDLGDVQNNRTWNSYKSRHYDASGNLIDDTVEVAKQNGFTPGSPVIPTPLDMLNNGTTNDTSSNAPASEPATSVSPSESPMPSPELTVTPSPSATPEATIEATPTPEPSVIPSETPTPTPEPVQS